MFNSCFRLFAVCGLVLLASAVSAREIHPDSSIDCSACSRWNEPVAPFRLGPNAWYVGTRGLSAVLISTSEGLILLDAALPQSAAQIVTRIRQLGFDPGQLRWIVNSHAHFDHAGGIAAIAEFAGAKVAASLRGAEALMLGDAPADDPQAVPGPGNQFPSLPKVHVIDDGAALAVGALNLVAHYTPGHTPGSTSWSWRACDAADRCLDMVYADSLTAVSAQGFRFSDSPERVAEFRSSIARVGSLKCDVVVSTHPEFVQLFERQARDQLQETDGCKRYAEAALARLEARLAQEASTP